MSNDVISLDKKRRERDERDGAELHARGQAFAFSPWDYDDDAIGMIGGKHSICVLFRPDELSGFAFTPETAEALGRALIEAARSPMARPCEECKVDSGELCAESCTKQSHRSDDAPTT